MKIHHVEQGTEEWLALRRGIITASEMKLIITPTMKAASNDKERAHLYELAAQRVTGYVEPFYINDDMLRGMEDEVVARDLYIQKHADVDEVGFITDDRWGFTIGYSPDGLVGDDGLIEIKSRRQKYQMETILTGIVPAEYMIQIQTGLLVTQRKWCDFISFSAGMAMFVQRVWPDPVMQKAIVDAATMFELKLKKAVYDYHSLQENMIKTERKVIQEIII